jgi:hypothetical protein
MKSFRIFGWEVRFRKIASPVQVAVEDAAAQLGDEALRMAFAVPEHDPRWRAIKFLTMQAINACATNATSQHVASDHGLLAHSAGGVAALRQYLDGLLEIREKALSDMDAE